ncbi:IS66 family insertion sequence element accessory protein TnpB [Providencia rettgeri]|uniref:IS66 family insertion sequence element accessory protein TnpB n=1 Tax=Proteus vulgaris TaxID=585 RepID=A0A6G6STP1_PROVU|nr:IS66 family insertion sequence element accessory protein TnpB [Providencia rettgeri]MBV2191576.1 IS66 family insertion sequence element accessory protein TnpB [Providencia rettgeri]QIF96409.1 hypothetical protein GTH24_21095 [Proteus vulgaris]QIG07639.1 hypothetical protein GTK47_19970 [Proteus sp. ZN5]
MGSGALFLFTNKQCDKVKVLYWDKTGFALWYIIANIYKADLRTNSFVSIHINS